MDSAVGNLIRSAEFCAELFDAVLNLKGEDLDEALGRFVRMLLESPQGGYYSDGPPEFADLVEAVAFEGNSFGYFAVFDRPCGYSSADRQNLCALAQLTGRLLKAHANTGQRVHDVEQAQALLRKQGQMLDYIHDSVITMDLGGFITGWNKGAERLFGYTAEEAIGLNILFLYADEDEEDAGDLLDQDSFLEHGGRELEVRRRKKSGEVFWASLTLSLVRNENGLPEGIVGYLNDITERLEARQELLLHARIFEDSDEGIIITDAKENIVSVNNSFCKISGYTAAEVMGKTPRLFKSGRHDADFYRDMWEAINSNGSWQGELWNKRKNGELYPEWTSISSVRNTKGNITHYFTIFSDITERKQVEDRINNLAYYDTLTGIPNRTMLRMLIEQALVEAARKKAHCSVLFIDLNRFKPINDTLGHRVGDYVLQQVSARFRATLRNEDVVARIGGDEFVVALFDVVSSDHASFVAQKLLASLEAPFMFEGNELRIGASIGISSFPEDGKDTDTLLRLADIAMYRVKQGNDKNDGYLFYSQEMNKSALKRLQIETGLRRAIDNNELLLHYQPKVDVHDGRIVGAEALIRWRHPEKGMVPPGDFIPVAEESGLVILIGEWVLRAACAQIKIWQDSGMLPRRVAINVSAREFTPVLPNRVDSMLDKHGLSPDWIELEITEGMLMNSSEKVIAMMGEVTDLGVTLSLDDFGTGYSSLSYLKRFPIDTLKIDRSFVIGIPGDKDDCAIASAIIGMAKQLGLNVIAEGVEDAEQFDFLRKAGCDEIQGYYFSRPLPSEDFEKLLREDFRFKV